MSSTQPSLPVTNRSRPRWRWLLVVITFVGLAWSLPRPFLQDVVIGHVSESETSSDANQTQGRLAFRTDRRLSELAAKGPLADETELSGPCFADAGESLYFARSRPGQRADIVVSHREGERWSRAEPVRELNSVDDDRRVTIDAKGQSLLLASNRSGTRGGFDLYAASRERDHWSRPQNVGELLNTEDDEFDPTLGTDGLTLYFVRKKAGETADIYVSRRETLVADWSAPQGVVSINSAETHERSPAISPDERFLYFASNRAVRSGAVSQFDLFRAALQNGVVGTPVLVQDGIASAADDVDAAFSADGRTLVFASKREGPKQLYQSHADFVVSRLGWDVEHLARFGRGKWAVPAICGMLFVVAVRLLRRSAVPADQQRSAVAVSDPPKKVKPNQKPVTTRAIEPPRSPERRVATIDQPKQRSAAPVNPLSNWSAASVSPSATSSSKAKPAQKSKESAATELPAVKPKGRRRLLAAAMLTVLAAGLLVAVKPTWQLWDEVPLIDGSRLVELVQFRDISPARLAERPILDRTNTARTTAPSILSESFEISSLRQVARWPNSLAVVRSRTEVDRVANNPLELFGFMKQLVVARLPLPNFLTQSREAAAEEMPLGVADVEAEKANSVASTIFVKQAIDLSSQDRTPPQPATVTSAALRMPQSLAGLLSAVVATNLSAVTRAEPMPHAGAASRTGGSAELPPTEMASPAIAVATSEPPLSPLPMVTNRSVIADVGAIPILNKHSSASSRVAGRPSLLTAIDYESSGMALSKNVLVLQLARQMTEPKVVTMIEDQPTTSINKTAEIEFVITSQSAPLSRAETVGPQPTSTTSSVVAIKDRVSVQREDKDLAAAVLTSPVVTGTGSITRREIQLREPFAVIGEEEIIKANNGGPALLLTSATQLVELLPPPVLTALEKYQSVGPMPTLSALSDASLRKWLPRTIVLGAESERRVETHPASVVLIAALPRPFKDATVAGIIEDVKPIDP